MSSNSQISNYIYQAHQAHKANDIKDFENLVSILLSFRPFQASTLKQIIDLFITTGHYNRAEALILLLHQFIPSSPDALTLLFYVYLYSMRVSLIKPFIVSINVSSSLIMSLSYQVDSSSLDTRHFSLKWASESSQLSCEHPYSTSYSALTKSTNRNLRIGFTSGDFCQHTVGLFILPVIRELTLRDDANLFFYDNSPRHDSISDNLHMHGEWRFVQSLDNATISEIILNDDLDILVDLSGHTRYSLISLFHSRLAKVQLSWLGYWATTGITETIDGVLADTYVVPPSSVESSFVEPIYHFDDLVGVIILFLDADYFASPVFTNNFITFGCFNSLLKFNNTLECWAKILLKCPNSLLYLKNYQLSSNDNCSSILQRFKELNVSPERLILEGPSSHSDLLNSYSRVDIALDTFPFNGGLTSCEALWLGLPLVSLESFGHSSVMASKQGSALLSLIERQQWIAHSISEYIDIAVSLTKDLQFLQQNRFQQNIDMSQSILCDSQFLANNLIKIFNELLHK